MTGIHGLSFFNGHWVGAFVLVAGLLAGCAQQEQAPRQARDNESIEAQAEDAPSADPAPSPAAAEVSPKPAVDSGSDLDHLEPAVADQLRAARADVLADPDGAATIGRLAILYHVYGMMNDAREPNVSEVNGAGRRT